MRNVELCGRLQTHVSLLLLLPTDLQPAADRKARINDELKGMLTTAERKKRGTAEGYGGGSGNCSL